jgi:hypothetical protein
MKIEITDAAHLKAVCDILESMGYSLLEELINSDTYINTFDCGLYYGIGIDSDLPNTTLTDLLKMRDELVKGNKSESI